MENDRLGNGPMVTDTTQVLGTPPAETDRTASIGPTAAEATRMGAGIKCSVCGTTNPGLETYCSECGFLLASVPGSITDDPASAAPLFELVEDRTGRVFPLREGSNTVGRESCDVLLMEPTVSRRHAQISVLGDTVDVMDTGSTNGTQVNGTPIVAQTSRPASPGSSIRFGSAMFTLRLTGESGPPAGAGDRPLSAKRIETPAETTVAMASEAPSAAPSTAAWLRGVEQDGVAPADIAIPLGTCTVGRRAGNDHVISGDPFVSGRHAEFSADGETITLTDLGSTNGTLVNGTRLKPSEPMALQEGDEISIGQGRYLLEFIPCPASSGRTTDEMGFMDETDEMDDMDALALDDDEPRGSAL